MSQRGIQKPWEGAMMAKSNDFENCCFVLFFAVNLEHQASQESPKTAKKPPKLPPNGHPEAVQKMVPFWTPISTRKVTPNWAPKQFQKWSKNGTCICRTKMEVKTESAVRCACTCTCKSCLRNKRKGLWIRTPLRHPNQGGYPLLGGQKGPEP